MVSDAALKALFAAEEKLAEAERARRESLGLPLYHVERAEEMGFPHARQEFQQFLQAVNACPYAPSVANAYFHLGRHDSRIYSAAAQAEGDAGRLYAALNFSAQPVSITEHGRAAPPVVWLGCDQKYLKFAEPFMDSMKAHGFSEIVLNVMPDHPLGPRYYHVQRFLDLADWMKANDRPVWFMDVDAIANKSPAELFPLLDGHDLAIRGRPGRLEPWNQLNASVIGFNNTAVGKSYLYTVAEFLRKAMRQPIGWGLDQLALLCAIPSCTPRISFLGPQQVNYDRDKNAVIWCMSGIQKHKN